MATRLEQLIEAEITSMVQKEFHGYAFKLKVDGVRGFPDRTILLPGGKIGFAEVKTDAGRPSAQQISFLWRLEDLGFQTAICRSTDDARDLIRRMIQS